VTSREERIKSQRYVNSYDPNYGDTDWPYNDYEHEAEQLFSESQLYCAGKVTLSDSNNKNKYQRTGEAYWKNRR